MVAPKNRNIILFGRDPQSKRGSFFLFADNINRDF